MNFIVVKLFNLSASISLSIKWAAILLAYLIGLLFESIVIMGVGLYVARCFTPSGSSVLFFFHSFSHWANQYITWQVKKSVLNKNTVGVGGESNAGKKGRDSDAFHLYLPGELLFILQDLAHP